MKTKLKLVLLMVVLLCTAFLQTKTSKQNDVVFSNIEALASWEGGTAKCIYTGSIDCPTSHVKVYRVY
ncbi:NVEALA domain-containing protein [Bacteroides sp. 51]|uniref:NVEALA domain-containing protein n=1 Tax=Bacteroides sp. 51 TaxID=2302938 RepID=UPI0013D4F896|nr:NVEALA domain-containing protein [Bacteroides sp. 51]NDV81659.1 hypothetical protein [Bacteroides sp. 51]